MEGALSGAHNSHMGSAPRAGNSQSGQALVEAALTLPLVVFIILGTMQLFMMQHARILTQLAAYRATRVGSTNHGNCNRMIDAALVQVMPAIESFMGRATGSPGTKLAAAFGQRVNNHYSPLDRISDGGNVLQYSGQIIWINRAFVGGGSQLNFDQPGNLTRLESQVVFWFPLRIPFANWVMARMFAAHFQIAPYMATNPLMATETAQWWGQDSLNARLGAELGQRIARNEYVFPIVASYSMRMMTPVFDRSSFCTR